MCSTRLTVELRQRVNELEDRDGNLRFLQAILAEIRLTADLRVLEIGCGTGLLGQFMSAVLGVPVCGLESSSALASIANKRFKCLSCPDGKIPDALGEFDLIYCKDMLMMVNDKREFYGSIRSHLRDGGTFCTYLPEEHDYARKPLFTFLPSSRISSLLCYGSLENNLQLLKESGFTNVRTSRLFLGSVQMNDNYVRRHSDGYFSNSESLIYEAERRAGLQDLLDSIITLEEFGVLVHYEWERTMVVAQ